MLYYSCQNGVPNPQHVFYGGHTSRPFATASTGHWRTEFAFSAVYTRPPHPNIFWTYLNRWQMYLLYHLMQNRVCLSNQSSFPTLGGPIGMPKPSIQGVEIKGLGILTGPPNEFPHQKFKTKSQRITESEIMVQWTLPNTSTCILSVLHVCFFLLGKSICLNLFWQYFGFL